MNIEQANRIPLTVILDKLNCKPARVNDRYSTYLSPLRIEKTPSFFVDHKKNVWIDRGTGEGGDVVAFACRWLETQNESHTIPDGLRWIKNMTGYAPMIASVKTVDYSIPDKKLVVREVKDIIHPSLIRYLQDRGIAYEVGNKYLRQVHVHNPEKRTNFVALGMKNEDKGYEFSNQKFEGTVGRKNITIIRGTKTHQDAINIFKGKMDFLSIVMRQKGEAFEDDSIILHSLSNLKKASPYLYQYSYKTAFTWMNNDSAGKEAKDNLKEYFKTQGIVDHTPMNILYEGFKDVNAWHVSNFHLGD